MPRQGAYLKPWCLGCKDVKDHERLVEQWCHHAFKWAAEQGRGGLSSLDENKATLSVRVVAVS